MRSFGAGAGRCSPPLRSLHPCLWRWCGQISTPALIASAPSALVLADAQTPALLASILLAQVLADARPPALLACAPLALVWAEYSAPPHSVHLLLRRWCWQMPAPPHSWQSLFLHWCWQMLAVGCRRHHWRTLPANQFGQRYRLFQRTSVRALKCDIF